MKLYFTESAKESFDLYKSDAPDIAERIREIIKDILLHPEQGIGAPVPLTGLYSGYWQRTFAPEQIIVYDIDDDNIRVASIGCREKALNTLTLDPFTVEDEKAVMNQMAANRGKDGEHKEARHEAEYFTASQTTPSKLLSANGSKNTLRHTTSS